MNILQKINILLKVLNTKNKIEKELKDMNKPGWQTTEFWLCVLSNIGALITALTGIIDAKTATIISAVVTCVYAILRTLGKNPDITTLVDNSTTKTRVIKSEDKTAQK